MSKHKKKAPPKKPVGVVFPPPKPAISVGLGDSCSPFLGAVENGTDSHLSQEISQRGAVARSGALIAAKDVSDQMAASRVAAGVPNTSISAFFHLPVRDLFALMIVSGMVGNSQMVYTDKVYAARAYLLADAMLERKKEDE